MSEEEDREDARQKQFSHLRPELDFLDLVTQGNEDCPAPLHVSDTTKTHYCTRPAGHSGQHYSFSGQTTTKSSGRSSPQKRARNAKPSDFRDRWRAVQGPRWRLRRSKQQTYGRGVLGSQSR